jgi:MoaA/NifB/PqqE/SkfB family radical SAM enzyme
MTSHAASVVDRFERPLRSLRLSVTDRCNLRCQYCMPEAEYTWLPKDDILHFEEIVRLVRIFVTLGVHRVRLTGGEPLLRRDLATLVRLLAACLAWRICAHHERRPARGSRPASARCRAGPSDGQPDTLDRETFLH